MRVYLPSTGTVPTERYLYNTYITLRYTIVLVGTVLNNMYGIYPAYRHGTGHFPNIVTHMWVPTHFEIAQLLNDQVAMLKLLLISCYD